MLEELKQGEIANVITQGLNPNAEMVEANTLLSTHIPAHWRLIRMRNLVREEAELVGKRTTFPLLSLTKSGVILRDIESGKGKFPKDFESYKVVEPGRLIFCLFDIDETPRTVGLSNHLGMITGAYDIFNINKSMVEPMFLFYYFLSVDNIKALRPLYSGLRKVVKMNKFLQITIPIPPLDEQREIIRRIESKEESINILITELQSQIEFLNEYKQRLIADAVTGQINVQNI